MKTLFLSIVILFNVTTVISQDSIRKFELGSTLITLNSRSGSFNTPSKPQYEIVNGLFFRITKKRMGLRFNMSYSEVNLKSEYDSNCWDCTYGNANHKNMIIGIGGQLAMLRKRDFLYAYMDLNYRNVFSSGYLSGGFGGDNDSFTQTSNGIETNVGVAFKFKIVRSVYLSAEPGYCIYSASVTEKRNGLTSDFTSTSHSTFIDVAPFFKLHLTTKF